MFSAEAIFPSVGKLVFLWLHVDIHVQWAASNFMGENQLGGSFPRLPRHRVLVSSSFEPCIEAKVWPLQAVR